MRPIRTRTFRRSRLKYPTAKAAWENIRRSIRGDFRGIKEAHNRKYWVFKIT